jgi:hypothetical protein
MPIRPFLQGKRFDPETTRIMVVAFELARIILRRKSGDPAEALIARRIIELAKAGERNPDVLCERVLFEFGKPGLVKGGRASRNEYHLIDLGRGLSCGGFNSLAAARQYAREENMVAWDIFHGNNLVERHDPRTNHIC